MKQERQGSPERILDDRYCGSFVLDDEFYFVVLITDINMKVLTVDLMFGW